MGKKIISWELDEDSISKVNTDEYLIIEFGIIEGCEWSLEIEHISTVSDMPYYMLRLIAASQHNEAVNYNVTAEIDLKNVAYHRYECKFALGVLDRNIGRIMDEDFLIGRVNLVVTIHAETGSLKDCVLRATHGDPIAPFKNKMSVEGEVESTVKSTQIDKVYDLSSDIKAMLDEKDSCDLTIKCNSSAFKAHKAILCARSSVFRAMLASPMQEKATGEILVDDIESEVFNLFLDFLYCGKIELDSVATANSLLYAAEKYQISSLKSGIVQYLKSGINIENCVQVLEIADIYEQSLKPDVIEFMCDNMGVIKRKQEWKTLKQSKPALALEVYSHIVED